MFNSQVIAVDAKDSILQFKHTKEDWQNSCEAMDSEFTRSHQLMRFLSAPSTLMAAHFSDEGNKDFIGRPSFPDTDSIFERYMSTSASPDMHSSSQYMEAAVSPQQTEFNLPAQHPIYSQRLPLPSHASRIDHSFAAVNSAAMDPPLVKSGGSCSNLIRHSSSPAGLFPSLIDGYGAPRSMVNYRVENVSTGEATTTSRLNFLQRQTSSPGLLSQIPELGGESIAARGSEGNSNQCYISGFPITPWQETASSLEDFSGLKRARDTNRKSAETVNRQCGLTHQFSLPKTSAEMDAVEKFLQLRDSVPCKIRAKRGCATHPRSIAERVRRTKISERMRKLQDLVPNMDKQTNTADMLDLAVEYIKELQKQVKVLSDSRATCTCSSKQNLRPATTTCE